MSDLKVVESEVKRPLGMAKMEVLKLDSRPRQEKLMP